MGRTLIIFLFLSFGWKFVNSSGGQVDVDLKLFTVRTLDGTSSSGYTDNDTSKYDYELKGLLKNQPHYKFKTGSKCIAVLYDNTFVWKHTTENNGTNYPLEVEIDPFNKTFWIKFDDLDFYTFQFDNGKWKYSQDMTYGNCKSHTIPEDYDNQDDVVSSTPGYWDADESLDVSESENENSSHESEQQMSEKTTEGEDDTSKSLKSQDEDPHNQGDVEDQSDTQSDHTLKERLDSSSSGSEPSFSQPSQDQSTDVSESEQSGESHSTSETSQPKEGSPSEEDSEKSEQSEQEEESGTPGEKSETSGESSDAYTSDQSSGGETSEETATPESESSENDTSKPEQEQSNDQDTEKSSDSTETPPTPTEDEQKEKDTGEGQKEEEEKESDKSSEDTSSVVLSDVDNRFKLFGTSSDGSSVELGSSDLETRKEDDKVVVKFKDGVKFTKLQFTGTANEVNEVWNHETKHGDKYPSEVKFDNSTLEVLVTFDNKHNYTYKYDQNESKHKLSHSVEPLDLSERPDKLKFYLKDDSSLVEIENKNLELSKVYKEESEFVVHWFRDSVKCHAVKYDNKEVWEYEDDYEENYPTSVYYKPADHEVRVFLRKNWYYFYKYDTTKNEHEAYREKEPSEVASKSD